MPEVQIAAARMAAAYDQDPYVRGWLEGYAAHKQQTEEPREEERK